MPPSTKARKENRRNLARTKAKEATGRTAQQEAEGKARVGARGKRESSRAMGGRNAKTAAARTTAPARRCPSATPGGRTARAGRRDEQRRNASSTSPISRCRMPATARTSRPRSGRAGPLLGLTGPRLCDHHRAARQARLSVPSPSRGERALLHPVRQRRGATRRAHAAGAGRRPDRQSSPAPRRTRSSIPERVELRYLAISDIGTVDVIDYPDSGKVAMAAGVKNADLSSATYKALGRSPLPTISTARKHAQTSRSARR